MIEQTIMTRITKWMEQIYVTTDFPSTLFDPKAETLSAGLMDSKARADLLAFAALVALEQYIERANCACAHDFITRQQVTILEGRDKCDFRLTTPIKFKYGRAD